MGISFHFTTRAIGCSSILLPGGLAADMATMSIQTLLFSLFSSGSVGPIESLPLLSEGLELKYIAVDPGYELGLQRQFWTFRRGEDVCLKFPLLLY